MSWVLCDHSSEQFDNLRCNPGILRNFDIFFFDNHDEFSNIVAFKGAKAIEHTEEHNTKRPDVGLDAVLFTFEDLRRHVYGRS